jgi:hypothetical protein
MIDEADRDGDGEISEEDFIRIMKKTNLFWNIIKKKIKYPQIIAYKIIPHDHRSVFNPS